MEIKGGPFGDLGFGEAVKKGSHPPWWPAVHGQDKGLMVNNSLTGELEPFKPAHGNRVLWYTCGPTVYDSCHMGHARAYLTFDILRRIMEDYFSYDVLYHVNITDIDDKIILRARRNKLISDYKTQHVKSKDADFETVRADVETALATKKDKFIKKRKELDTPLPAGTPSRLVDEHATAGKEFCLKERQLEICFELIDLIKLAHKEHNAAFLKAVGEKSQKALGLDTQLATVADINAAVESAIANIDSANDTQATIAAVGYVNTLIDTVRNVTEHGLTVALIEAARTEIGEQLDSKFGDSITDKQIFDDHARYFEREYMEDMAALGVREPDVLTRVTEYVQQIQEFIQKIVEKGLAYAANGSVYLSIEDFKKQGHSYRKLKPFDGETSAAAMAESEGALGASTGDKKHPNDFVLWKASKAGEPQWQSPWGLGRPGWHIECSVVASDILGPNIDVHAGGVDLMFPHHDNELAQSEAYHCNQQWVNYFFHAGHLHIEGLKMSKSLKNFIRIREALAKHTARQLRLMFLTQAWDKPMEYSLQTANEAKRKESIFKNFFGRVRGVLREDWLAKPIGLRNKEHDMQLIKAIQTAQQEVHAALCQNFNTKGAIAALLDLVGAVNRYLDLPDIKPATLVIQRAGVYVTQILRVFGVVEGSDSIGFPSEEGVDKETVLAPFLQAFVDFREAVRSVATKDNGKILEACDRVRDEVMPRLGVCLEDSAAGPTWRLDSPEALLAKIAEEAAAKEAAKLKKLKSKLDQAEKNLKLAQDKSVPPSVPEFSKEEFTDEGWPTERADGKKVNVKKQMKAFNTQKKKHETFVAKCQKEGVTIEQHLATLNAIVDSARAALADSTAVTSAL